MIWFIFANAVFNAFKGGSWHIVSYWVLVSIYWLLKKKGH